MVHEENKEKNKCAIMVNVEYQGWMQHERNVAWLQPFKVLPCSSESLAASLQLSAQKTGWRHTEWSVPTVDPLIVSFQLPKTTSTNTTAVIMELSYFMRSILPENSSHSTCQEIPHLSQNIQVHYCVHNTPASGSCY